MGFTRRIIPSREVKRQRLEKKKQVEEELIGKNSDDIMHLTNGNDTNPPTYKSVEYNGSDNNDVDDNNDIVTNPVSKIEELMLALPPSNCRACRCK